MEGRQRRLHKKIVADETQIRKSKKFLQIVGIDVMKIYSYSIWQNVHTRLYTRFKFHADLQTQAPPEQI